LKVQQLKPADFKAFLKNEKQESPKRQKLNDQTVLLTTKGNRHILFETHDHRDSAGWIHRSFLATPKPKK
jgi:predicted RNA-binding protein associated with RNAse of E/G family